jgi:hypothetical protein
MERNNPITDTTSFCTPIQDAYVKATSVRVQINLRYDERSDADSPLRPKKQELARRFGLAGLPKPMKYDLMLVLIDCLSNPASQPVPFSSLIRQPPRLLRSKAHFEVSRIPETSPLSPVFVIYTF